MLQKSLCAVPEAVAASSPTWVVSVAPGMFSEEGPPGQGCDVFILSSSGVPVLLFRPCHSHCSVVWLPLEAIFGTAVAGLVSAMCSTGLKHIPDLCPCWGPAQPCLQAPLLVSFFLSLPLYIFGSTFTSAHTWLPLRSS